MTIRIARGQNRRRLQCVAGALAVRILLAAALLVPYAAFAGDSACVSPCCPGHHVMTESARHAGHAAAHATTTAGHVHGHAAAACNPQAGQADGSCHCDGVCATAAGIVTQPVHWSAPPAATDLAGMHEPAGPFPVLGVPTPPPQVG